MGVTPIWGRGAPARYVIPNGSPSRCYLDDAPRSPGCPRLSGFIRRRKGRRRFRRWAPMRQKTATSKHSSVRSRRPVRLFPAVCSLPVLSDLFCVHLRSLRNLRRPWIGARPFEASIKTPASRPDLFLPKRDHRIHPRRPSRRHDAREQRDQGDHARHRGERQRVARLHLEEQRRRQPCQP